MNNIIKIKPLHEPSTQSAGMDGTKKDIEEERASDAFKPLIRFLEIFGSYSPRQKRGRKFTIHFTYCILVQILVFVLSARYLIVFRNGSRQLYKTIGLVAYLYYYANVTVFSFIYFYSNCKYLQTFLSTLNKYNVDYGVSFNISHKRKVIRRILLIILGIFVIYAFLFIWSVIYLELKGLLVTSNFAPFDQSNGITFNMATIIFGVLGVLHNGIAISNTALLLLNTCLLKQEFKKVTRRIRDIIKVQQLDDLESLRLQHECIVELVQVGNLMFRHIGGMAYVYGIPMVCLTLYGATMRSLDTVDICALASVMMVVVIVMFVITFMGAYMCQAGPLILLLIIDIVVFFLHVYSPIWITNNEEQIMFIPYIYILLYLWHAHEPLDDLYKINLSKQSPQIISQIQIFISRLTGTNIGINVYGLFVIDHSTILMVFGTIISYAVIVVQFSLTPNCQTVYINSTYES